MLTVSERGDVRECLHAARTSLREIRKLLSHPSPESADRSAALLRDVEVQLGLVAAMLRGPAAEPDRDIRSMVEELQEEVGVLAKILADADKLLTGWLGAIRTRRGGYTGNGQAAPLVLVKKLTVEG